MAAAAGRVHPAAADHSVHHLQLLSVRCSWAATRRAGTHSSSPSRWSRACSWSLTAGDLMLVLGLVCLFFEVLKSTNTGRNSVIEHMLSTLLLRHLPRRVPARRRGREFGVLHPDDDGDRRRGRGLHGFDHRRRPRRDDGRLRLDDARPAVARPAGGRSAMWIPRRRRSLPRRAWHGASVAAAAGGSVRR